MKTPSPRFALRLSTVLVAAALSAAAMAAEHERVARNAVPDAQGDITAPMEGSADALDALQVQPDSLNVNALTDDHSVNVPTGWWTYTNITAAQVSSYLATNSARLTQVEVYGMVSGQPRFTVRMVSSGGAYAVPGWWWYYNLTAAQLATNLTNNNARLIDVTPYDIGGGVIRYTAVMVSNTAGAARAWSYLMGVSSAQITSHINSSGHRMIDIDSYTEGGVKKYTAAFVANTGTDSKSWQWFINQSTASIATKVAAFNGRIVKLDRQSNGTYNFIQVANTGSDASAWWHQFGFRSMTDLNNYSLQVASRPVDITTYLDSSNVRRYDASFIDNANTSTRRMRSLLGATFLDANGNPTLGIFESYLKQVNGDIKVNLNGSRRAETASALKSLHLLHSMKRVQAGTDTLASAFTYYEYDVAAGSDACPDPAKETVANRRTNYNFETGLDQMMAISDNRTTRGTVLRYGGFSPFNSTATSSGLTGTTLRHNIGCAYWNFTTQKYDTALRNDTTAADMAHIYEGVWNSTLLTNTNSARSEFLESANPGVGASSSLQTIINQEAAALGKSSIAAQFGSLVRTYGKGGSYGTCLPDANGACGQKVIVRSGVGLIRLPNKPVGLIQTYRDFAFGRLISDTPVPCWEDFSTGTTTCQADTDFTNAYNTGANELYRDEVRSSLLGW